MLNGLNTSINGAERKLEKAGNHIKYGTAAIATAGAGIGAVKLITKSKDVMTSINKDTVKEAGTSLLQGIKNLGTTLINPEFYKGIFKTVQTKYDILANSVKTSGVKATIGKVCSRIWGTVRDVGGRGLVAAKNSLFDFVKGIPGALKKVPAGGWIAAATAATLLIIAHKHGYNSGKIEQKYDDRQKLFEQIG